MDLDDDELKATRELNGSNKNVGSMEEDINKLIEELTNVRPDELSIEGLKLFNKINEIIDKNKELKEENKIWKDNYYEQKEFNNKQALYIIDNFIPVSLVEEKIEEIDKIYKCIPEDEGNFAKAILIKEKQVLQELLEKRK